MICGIDPGLKGAIFLSCEQSAIDFIPLIGNRIDGYKFKIILQSYLNADCKHIFIEKPIAMKNQGVTGTATTFENYGRMMALIETSGLEFTEVNPNDWTKVIFKGMPALSKPRIAKEKKERSLKRAWQLYPKYRELIVTDGQADAALIAYYGQVLNGKERT